MGVTARRADAAVDVPAFTTAEMLAALPEGLMLPEGATPSQRRVADVLALYRAVFLNSTEPVAIIDSVGRYLEQNAAHEALLGYSAEELRGQTPAIHLGDETFRMIALELQRFGQSRNEVVSRSKDGQQRVLELSSFAVRDRSGRAVCYVGIGRDVTDQREAARALERRFEELRAIYRMAEALGQASAPEEMYDEAIDGLMQATHADRASILLFDGDGVMRFKAWHGLSDGYRAAVEGHSPWTRDTRDPQPVAIAQLARTGPHSAEIAFAVADSHQHRGIGSALAAELLADARAAGITQITALASSGNPAALALLRRTANVVDVRFEGPELSIRAAIA